jgi:hypothetical protein
VVLQNRANTYTDLNTFSNGITVSSGLTLYNYAILDNYLSSNVCLLTATQTLTNKTLTSPIISTISNTGTITLPTTNTTLVGTNTTNTLTNKTLTAPKISTIVNGTGTLTLPINITDTLIGQTTIDTLTNKTLTAPKISTISNGTGTLTLPINITDTLIGRATTDTLSNKTIDTGIFTTISTFNGYVDTNAGLAVNLGQYLTFGNSTNTIFSQIGQYGNDLSITNYGTGSIVFSSPVVDFTNTYSYFKGGTNSLGTSYNTHFPYSGDNKNYITGETHLRGGDIIIDDGTLYCYNGFSLTAGTLTLPNYSILDSYLSTNVCLLTATQTLTNKTLTNPTISTILNTGTLTLPTSTDTLIGRATTDTLSNKTLTTPIIAQIKPSSTNTLTLPNLTDTLVSLASANTFTNTNSFNSAVNFNNNISLKGSKSLLLYNTLNTIFTTIFQSGATLKFTNTSTPSQYLFEAYDGFGSLYTYTIGSTLTCGGDIVCNTTSLTLKDGTNTTTNFTQAGGNCNVQNTKSSGSINFTTQDATINTRDVVISYTGVSIPSLLTCNNGFTLSSGSLTLPNSSISDTALSSNVVLLSASQTLTNKTLTNPTISTILNTGTLTLPTSTDTLIGRATTDTLSNKTLTTPIIAQIKPTSLLTLTLPTLTDTLVSRTSTDTLTNKTLTNPTISTILNTGTLTLPTSTDTLIGRTTTDTLSNKTIDTTNIINDGALSTNIPKINVSNTFTNTNIFQNSITLQSNINLQSTFTTSTSGQLGYKHQGTILNVPSPASMTTATPYYLASMTLPVGVWNVIGQYSFQYSGASTSYTESASISTSSTTMNADNMTQIRYSGGSTEIVIKRINDIFTSSGTTALYLNIMLTFITGPLPQYTSTTQANVRFYAVRIA